MMNDGYIMVTLWLYYGYMVVYDGYMMVYDD